jgi:hypothetical protein
VVDNFALELEVGLLNIDLEILKFAFQGTVGMKEDGSVGHGLQGLVEYVIEEDAFISTALYILGAHSRSWHSSAQRSRATSVARPTAASSSTSRWPGRPTHE